MSEQKEVAVRVEKVLLWRVTVTREHRFGVSIVTMHVVGRTRDEAMAVVVALMAGMMPLNYSISPYLEVLVPVASGVEAKL